MSNLKYLEHFEILTYNANIGILNGWLRGEISLKKFENNFPILDLAFKIGICTNITIAYTKMDSLTFKKM